MASTPGETVTARRLNELRRAHPADATLQNLLVVLGAKLDLCARLPIFEYESASEGHDECATVFQGLARDERASVNELLRVLRSHLDRTLRKAAVEAS